MGEAKRRKQNDPNYGKTSHARKTHKMLNLSLCAETNSKTLQLA